LTFQKVKDAQLAKEEEEEEEEVYFCHLEAMGEILNTEAKLIKCHHTTKYTKCSSVSTCQPKYSENNILKCVTYNYYL